MPTLWVKKAKHLVSSKPPFQIIECTPLPNTVLFCFCLQGPEDGEESDSNAAIQTEKQTEVRISEVGRVMTEEEYEEWKKEREGGKQNEEDTGIDWGMGNNLY